MDNLTAITNLLFAGTVAAAAVVALFLNRGMLKETAALRKAETDPFVAVYIEQGRAGVFFFDLVIRNVARGPAYDVKFEVSPDIEIEDGDNMKLTTVALVRDGILFMAPGQEIRFHYGDYVSLKKVPITVEVSYRDAPTNQPGSQLSGTFVLDVGKYDGMSQLEERGLPHIVKALEDIQKDFHAIRAGQAELKVANRRRYSLTRYIDRRWNHFFGSRTFGNFQDSPSDLLRAFRTQRKRRNRK